MPLHPSICTHSLGRAWLHPLRAKLLAAASHSFSVELFYEDLHFLARDLSSSPSPSPAHLRGAARHIRRLCDDLGLKIISLQPFMHYEGLLDRGLHRERLEEMETWITLCGILGTDLVAVPSTFLPESEVSGDLDLIVSDLRELADLGAPRGIRFAYEALCWGTHVDTWEKSWEIVELVDRGNFGICLDTFNIAGRIFADPSRADGKNPDAEEELRLSLRRMVETVDVRKIAYVQVVDAERLAKPLVEGHELYDACQPARMSWSRSCRLFYGEEERGAYLPIREILKAIVADLGFEGCISAEVFSKSLIDPSPRAPEELAWRAAVSWRKILRDLAPVEKAVPVRRQEIDSATRAQL